MELDPRGTQNCRASCKKPALSIRFTANTQFLVHAREADVIQRAKSLRLQAERRLGEILRDMPKHLGGRPADITGDTSEPVNSTTLADLGIDKRTSSRAQKLAALPEKTFAAVASGDMPVAKAIAPPVKKHTAKTRRIAALDAHQAVFVNEGSTYLISAMRSATKAIEGAGDNFKEYEKTMVMAARLQAALSLFIKEQQSEQAAFPCSAPISP